MNSTYDQGYSDALEKLGFSTEKEASIAGRVGRFMGKAKGLFRGRKPQPSYVQSVSNSIKGRAPAAAAAAKAAPTRSATSVGGRSYSSPGSGVVSGTSPRNYGAKAPATAPAAGPSRLRQFGGKALKYGLPAGALVGGVAAMRATNKPKANPIYRPGAYETYQSNELPQYR